LHIIFVENRDRSGLEYIFWVLQRFVTNARKIGVLAGGVGKIYLRRALNSRGETSLWWPVKTTGYSAVL